MSGKKNADKIKELEEHIADLEGKWKRARADYANLERRFGQERETISAFIKRLVISEFLPIFSCLKKAADHDHGSQLICKQFEDVLESLGVEEIESEGKQFDPSVHEAVEVVAGEKDKVVEVVEGGFKLAGEIIRPAKVKVGKGE